MAVKQGLLSSLLGTFSRNKQQDELEEVAAIEARRRLQERIEQALAERIPPESETPPKSIRIEAA